MYIVFDIGATNIRFARVLNSEKIDEPIIEPNPQQYEKSREIMKEIIGRISGGEKIEGMVGGIAGVLSSDRTFVYNSPNLPDWNNKPLVKDLEKISGAPVILYNDAELTALGEAVYGAGRGSRTCAYMTISTGIGGALVVEGEVLKTHLNVEPGHQIIDYKNNTSLHQLISGREIEKEYGEKAKDIDDPILWNKVETILAVGLHNAIVFWSPDTFVLGGGIMKDLDIPDLENILNRRMSIYAELPRFVRAELGSFNGLYGGLAHVKKHFLDK